MSGQFVTIDGISVEIENEKNLLALIRKAGIDIPTFCYHPDLSIFGACRLCVVENERGMIVASCSELPRPNASYKTNTERLRKYRKMIMELILANHCNDCTTCENSCSCKLQEFAKRYHIDGIRFPNRAYDRREIDNSSPSIVRDSGKCILCGQCVRMCNEIQNVGAIDFAHRGSRAVIKTSFGKPLTEVGCVGCGQCAAVCPTGAIVVRNNMAPVWKAISDPGIRTTVEVAPAVRVAITKELGIENGVDVMGKITAALHRIGFDEVYDTCVTADLTIVEETTEFVERFKKNENLPIMTSCCPGWIRYCETKHPELMHFVSTCRSPMQMFAAVLHEEAKKYDKPTYHVAIMPCTAKKFEAARDEFKIDGEPIVNMVLTTQELIRMIKEANIDFLALEPEPCDNPFGEFSGAGVIFGASGGVCEAVIRMAVGETTGERSKETLDAIAKFGQRGMDSAREFDIPFMGKTLHVGVASGLANAEKLLQKVIAGEHFDIIEVMACPGGCVCGGGQPVETREGKEKRAAGLYKSDEAMGLRHSEKNPVLKHIYDNIVKGRNHELLHVHYPAMHAEHK